MHNHPYEHAPKRWADYFCGSEANQAEVDYLQRIVAEGASALPRSLFITGKSGVGKTSLVLLLIRSFRCLTRPASHVEPCGKCEACKDIDVRLADRTLSGVVWVQPGSYTEETLNHSVKIALQTAAKGAVNTGSPERDILFVVFDEWQEFARNLRQQVLLRTELEVPGNQVCYIFLTMREEDLAEEDRIALMRRSGSGVIRIGTLPNEAITQFLKQTYPTLDNESAEVLAGGAKGRLGLATALYDSCIEKFETVSPEVAAYIAQVARDEWRWELWEKIQGKKNFMELLGYLKPLLEIVSPLQLCQQLQEDILQSAAIAEQINNDQILALNLLTQYEVVHKSANFINYVVQLMGLTLVSRDGVMRSEHLEVLDYVTN